MLTVRVNVFPPTIQPFILPQIKFAAEHYCKLIDVHHDGVGHFYYSPASFYGKETRRRNVSITVSPLLRNSGTLVGLK